ncbi:hypothetical protein, partial [Pontibacter harenae]|uniref:hypothetical protein n=1 Tax=Pontibacter harenae TaxID=2894083 RepID=UPI001E3F895D
NSLCRKVMKQDKAVQLVRVPMVYLPEFHSRSLEDRAAAGTGLTLRSGVPLFILSLSLGNGLFRNC